MILKDLHKYSLPIWWMTVTEILLTVFAIYFITDGQYIEALLTGLLIEFRDMNWSQKKAL